MEAKVGNTPRRKSVSVHLNHRTLELEISGGWRGGWGGQGVQEHGSEIRLRGHCFLNNGAMLEGFN